MTQDLPPGLGITVTAGSPTDEEVAALAAVVAGLAAAQSPPEDRRPPAWGRAARLEALGQAPLVSSTDPRLGRP